MPPNNTEVGNEPDLSTGDDATLTDLVELTFGFDYRLMNML